MKSVKVGLLKADLTDAEEIHKMQIEAFHKLLGKYQDYVRLCEELHGDTHWELDTILQEPKNCYLYEKAGYRKTGKVRAVNDKLTLVSYEK